MDLSCTSIIIEGNRKRGRDDHQQGSSKGKGGTDLARGDMVHLDGGPQLASCSDRWLAIDWRPLRSNCWH